MKPTSATVWKPPEATRLTKFFEQIVRAWRFSVLLGTALLIS